MIPASVSVSVTRENCAKTAERIDVLFGGETPGNPRLSTVRERGFDATATGILSNYLCPSIYYLSAYQLRYFSFSYR